MTIDRTEDRCARCGFAKDDLLHRADEIENLSPVLRLACAQLGGQMHTYEAPIAAAPSDERICTHGVDSAGKVICDCFIGLFVAALEDDPDGMFDVAEVRESLASLVHDIDNALAAERRTPAPVHQIDAEAIVKALDGANVVMYAKTRQRVVRVIAEEIERQTKGGSK